jgi:UDP-galactopyranose mutase
MGKSTHKVLIVGAGFSGAVIARDLADLAAVQSVVIDARPHVAGNCHMQRAPDSGVMEHVYGPHIFHTSNAETWNYANRFAPLIPFTNRVKASTTQGIFSFPINLHTINQFFGKRLNPQEARQFIATIADRSIEHPANFEEQALQMVGRELYETFFMGYTRKQWGCDPKELPASILKRLPVRFDYNDSYYADTYVGIPERGYTALVENMLDHPCIEVRLSTPWEPAAGEGFDHVFFTGSIDAFFAFSHGRLGYRTVYWDRQVMDGDFQGNAVINYPGMETTFTRVHEHKHFAPWEHHTRTAVYTEFSKETSAQDIPYYPKRLKTDLNILEAYQKLAAETDRVTFLGRLASYRYLDMNIVIEEARAAAKAFAQSL